MEVRGRIYSYFGPAAEGSLRTQAGVVAHKAHRLIKVAALNFLGNNVLLWASALTYTVTLSIVPILALAFSVLKALGGIEHLRPLIDKYVALGSPQVSAYLLHFISNVNAGTLGSGGGAALLLTVISTLGTIERAFDTIWRCWPGAATSASLPITSA
jgi:uncharacterized BrkB/YihY/UPF0761 family membrane protein